MVSKPVRSFGKVKEALEIPDLVAVQRNSYEKFIQSEASPAKRAVQGLEGLFREIFPIENYDGSLCLEYLYYELEKPRYGPQECRKLRLTYGYPLKVTCRLRNKEGEDLSEQSIYIGEMPVMVGGGEFIINGSERVIVNQLHRSPGVDFLIESKEGDRILHGGRIIPERGSWIEISVTKKDVLVVKIDQSSKIPATIFMRAISEQFGSTEEIIRHFYPTKKVQVSKITPNMWAVGSIVDKETGEILVKAGTLIGDRVSLIQQSELKRIEVVEDARDAIILNTLAEDDCPDRDQSLLKFYMRLRPGNPANLDKAKQFFEEKFFDSNRYRLGMVGRFRLNRKFNQNVAEDEMTLRPDDFLNSVKYILGLRNNEGVIDDIDHLGNRRLRTIDELAADEIRKGLLKLRKTVQERMSIRREPETVLRIADIVNSKSVSSSINYFFGRGELSQVVDQTNALSQLTHERRLSALGPGGLNRRRAGFEVRDVHISHYGRICPIETPEGTNIGLISSLAIFAKIDQYGFLLTPYHKVKNGKVTDKIVYLRADEEMEAIFSPPSTVVDGKCICKISEVKKDKNKEKPITNWMKDNIECLTFSSDFKDIDVEKALKYFESKLRIKTEKEKDPVNRLLSFVEDRLIIEYADSANNVNDKDKPTPYFNRDYPKNDYQDIKKTWEKAPESIQKWFKDILSEISTSQAWNADHGVAEAKPGIYVFRKKQSSRDLLKCRNIVYVGIASKLAKRLSEHWSGNVEGSGLRWHVWKEFVCPETKAREIRKGMVLARRNGELSEVEDKEVDYVDISPKQIVGLSASLIPFLEHDDANRALMGSNMQRQAVPLLRTEVPLVGTGMEHEVGKHSSMVVRAENSGVVTEVDASHIVINQTDEYPLAKFVGLNERTCLNQQPVVKLGEKVKKGQILADGGGTNNGVLSLGKNVLVGFVSFDGFNFEDAIIISERLVKNDSFTSIHIDEFTAEVRETRLGREEFTRDIPNVGEKALRNLDENGIVIEGTRVCPGDILVGKVVPKSKTELTPEEKLLHAIFGRAGEDVKNDSLEVPSGYEGVVIKTEKFTRRGAGGEDYKKAIKAKIKEVEKSYRTKECYVFRQMIDAIHKKYDVTMVDPSTRQKAGLSEDDEVVYEQVETFGINWVKPASLRADVQKLVNKFWSKITELQEQQERRVERLKHGDELPSGVMEMVKIYVAAKRTLSIGDKMAGRHGNKGIIAKIMPEENMPFLEDGTPLDILLNPLGVPSRMNVGQILETHLGLVAKVLGFRAVTPVFDGATEEDIKVLTEEANDVMRKSAQQVEDNNEAPSPDELFINVPDTLKTQLYDGRTGEPFDQRATIGYIYMMKLHHLVDDKIHARATGPYSLITQQPLGGKARTGGQRFGEMEVWALEGYGAAYMLQEMLTVKSDDVEGRTKIYESMVKGQNTLEAGTPLSFDVLCNELRGLGLNIQLEKNRLGASGL